MTDTSASRSLRSPYKDGGSFPAASATSSTACDPDACALEAEQLLQMQCDKKDPEEPGGVDEEESDEDMGLLCSVKMEQHRESESGGKQRSDRATAPNGNRNGNGNGCAHLWPNRTHSESFEQLWRSAGTTAIADGASQPTCRPPPNSPPPTPIGSTFTPVSSVPEFPMGVSESATRASPQATPVSTGPAAAASATTTSTTQAAPWSATLLERLGVPDAVLRELSCAYLNAIAAHLNANLRAMNVHPEGLAPEALGYGWGPSWAHSPPEEETAAAAQTGAAGLRGVGSESADRRGREFRQPPSPGWDLARLLQVISFSQQLGCALASASASAAPVPGNVGSAPPQAPECGARRRRGCDSADGGSGELEGRAEEEEEEEGSATQEPLDLTTSFSIASALHYDH